MIRRKARKIGDITVLPRRSGEGMSATRGSELDAIKLTLNWHLECL